MDYSSQHIYRVSELTKEVRLLLEASYPAAWIEGEISNLARPASGHLYFTLKDDKSQVRCAFFRGRMNRLACRPENGMRVRVNARISLYENRGDFQLIVSHLEQAGAGDLQAEFEKLKRLLNQEGLFSAEHKKPLPRYPQSIGVITSATGAVIEDIISTCRRRYPITKLVLYPVQVQGEQAATDIIEALAEADEHNHELLIIGRGGGSLEDLWAFNNERVARSMFSCRTPIISAVGHDVDVTIADFVADVRAPTPTAAAELATPDAEQMLREFVQIQKRIILHIKTHINRLSQQTDLMTYRLTHPAKKLAAWQQLNAQLRGRLMTCILNRLHNNKLIINNLLHAIDVNSPVIQVRQQQQNLNDIKRRLVNLVNRQLDWKSTQVNAVRDKLVAISPQSTLERGYAIVKDANSSEILRSVGQVKPGCQINVQLSDGRFDAITKSQDVES